MPKCAVVGCTRKIIGGFRESIDVSHLQGSATIRGLRTFWCEEHEQTLIPRIFGKKGVLLKASELDD